LRASAPAFEFREALGERDEADPSRRLCFAKAVVTKPKFPPDGVGSQFRCETLVHIYRAKMEFTNLPRPLIDPEIEALPRGQSGQSEAGQSTRSQQIQRRMDARIQAAEAQKTMARAMEKNANYMLWATLLACLTTILAVATIVFEVFVGFPRPPH
jgi:hypothetical protein